MSTWYAATPPAEADRLVAAWPEAPIENLELCSLILDTAREQVAAYAPADAPATFEPVTITWPDGSTATLSRTLETVTAVMHTVSSAPKPNLAIPAEFAPPGPTTVSYQNAAIGRPGGILVQVTGSTQTNPLTIASAYVANGPWTDQTFIWEPRSAAGTGVPTRHVYAQLQQARNLWNAGRAGGDGDLGPEGFTFTPRPLDKTIRDIIRPRNVGPHVL